MKQIVIKITVPNNGDVWKISIGKGRPRQKKNAVSVYRHAERFLTRKESSFLASEVDGKIKIVVDYHLTHQDKSLDWKNEGIYVGKNDALYVLACFLEDYLPINYQKAKYKLYGSEFIDEEGNLEVNTIK